MPEGWKGVMGGRKLSQNELKDAARELIRECGSVRTWLFSGEIGAGKTTLIKAVCEQLGVKDGMSSPTFSIINEYRPSAEERIYHFDFYRLKNEREAYDLGAEEYFDSGHFCFVEWPERIPSLIPQQYIEVNLKATDPTHRIIQYARHD